ncbi:MAG: Swt1 family HEPN domain-containing protein [Gammaproteobacteria bacterium]
MNLVFITTCSKNKAGGGHGHGDWPNATLAEPDLLKDRASLFDEIRRSDTQMLRGAVQGPDFGGDASVGGSYLQAYSRYLRGNFMTSLKDELEKQLDSWFTTNKLFFISGLYGLVDAMEPVQNYDVGATELVTAYWKKNRQHLTEALIRQLPDNAILLDCCGERIYSEFIKWDSIEENHHIPVYHAIDPERDGAQIRAEAGKHAATEINEKSIPELRAGKHFDGTNASIKFVSNADFIKEARSMRQTVFEGMELLPSALEPFVKDRLGKSLGNRWRNIVVETKILSEKQLPNGQIHWDLAALLKVMDRFWKEAFKNLPPEMRSIVNELLVVRNKVSHHGNFSADDATRALDSMCRLAEAIDAKNEATKLRKMRDFIIR